MVKTIYRRVSHPRRTHIGGLKMDDNSEMLELGTEKTTPGTDLRKILCQSKYKMTGGILFRYESLMTLSSIFYGRQLRLTRCDLSFKNSNDQRIAMDEALGVIFDYIKQHGYPIEIADAVKGQINALPDGVVLHRFPAGKYEKCIPYVLCFTTVKRDSEEDGLISETEKTVVNRDVRMIFNTDDMGLQLQLDEQEFSENQSCPACLLNATECDFVELDCRKEILRSELESFFELHVAMYGRDWLSHVMSQSSISFITGSVCKYWLTHADRKVRRQTRLVFFLPVEAERYPDVMRFVHGRRFPDGKGGYYESSLDSEHIYLNFADKNVKMNLVVRSDRPDLVELCANMARKAGFDAFVTCEDRIVRS